MENAARQLSSWQRISVCVGVAVAIAIGAFGTTQLSSAAGLNVVPDRDMPSLPSGGDIATAVAYDSLSQTYFVAGQFQGIGLNRDGVFTTSAARKRLVAINAQTGAVRSFNPGVEATSIDVLYFDQASRQLYVGGQLTTVANQSRAGLARFTIAADGETGALDNSFAPALNQSSRVYDISIAGSSIYVAGKLAFGSGSTGLGGVVKISSTGVVDTGFVAADANFGGVVRTVTYDGSALWVGGDFDDNVGYIGTSPSVQKTWLAFGVIGGQSRSGVAQLNPTTGSATSWQAADSFKQTVTNHCGSIGTTVYDIVVVAQRLLVAGCFDSLSSGASSTRDNFADLDVTTGEIHGGFRLGTTNGSANGNSSGDLTNGPIYKLYAVGNDLYLAGAFGSVFSAGATTSVPVRAAARVGLDSGFLDADWSLSPIQSTAFNYAIYGLAFAQNASNELDQVGVVGEFKSFGTDPSWTVSGYTRAGFATVSRSPVWQYAHAITSGSGAAPGTGVQITVSNSPGTGIWDADPAPTAYGYEWMRCGSTLTSSCQSIGGLGTSGTVADLKAVGAVTYTTKSADVGFYIQLWVRAINANQREVSGSSVFAKSPVGPVKSTVTVPSIKDDAGIDLSLVESGEIATCLPPKDAPVGASIDYTWKLVSINGTQTVASLAGHPNQFKLLSSQIDVGVTLRCELTIWSGNNPANPDWTISKNASRNLVRTKCPVGTTGTYPTCVPVVVVEPPKTCPEGTDGTPPICVARPKDGTDGKDGDGVATVEQLEKNPPKFVLALGSAKRIKFNKQGKAKLAIAVTNVSTPLWLSTTFKSFRAKPKKGVYKSKAIPGGKITASSEKLAKNGTVVIKLTASKGLRKVLGKGILGNAKISLVASLASGAAAAKAPTSGNAYRSAGVKVNMQSPKARLK